jgi:hypothetical protein
MLISEKKLGGAEAHTVWQVWQVNALVKLMSVFRWIVTTDRFLLGIAVLIVGGSFALSLTTDAWHWFQRSGALLVSIGAIFSTRHVLKLSIDAMLYEQSSNEVSAARETLDDSEITTCFIGFCMVGVGTLTWAYGDLAGCVLGSSCL